MKKADKVKTNKDTLKLIKEKRKLRRQYEKQKPANKTAKTNAYKQSFLPSLWKGTLGSRVTISMTRILGKSTSF